MTLNRFTESKGRNFRTPVHRAARSVELVVARRVTRAANNIMAVRRGVNRMLMCEKKQDVPINGTSVLILGYNSSTKC